MGKHTQYHRIPWLDRFNTPSLNDLRSALPAASAGIFDRLRKRLCELDGVNESFAWHGDCWHWTLEFRSKHSKQPLALLIPSPSDLQLALPIDQSFAESLPLKRMKRAIREGLELAQEPFDTRWGIWSLTASTPMDDLLDLVELKRRHLAKMVG